MIRGIITQARSDMRHPHFTISRKLACLLALAVPLLLAGCVYRLNIQQGNFLEGKTVDQLQVGMTRSQTRYLLGTPMVPDAFDRSRWDYVYYLKRGRLKRPVQRHLIVYFENDKVSQIDRAAVPSAATIPMPDPEQPVPKANKVPDSDPSRTQPVNPGGTQPGAPQPQAPQPPPADPGK